MLDRRDLTAIRRGLLNGWPLRSPGAASLSGGRRWKNQPLQKTVIASDLESIFLSKWSLAYCCNFRAHLQALMFLSFMSHSIGVLEKMKKMWTKKKKSEIVHTTFISSKNYSWIYWALNMHNAFFQEWPDLILTPPSEAETSHPHPDGEAATQQVRGRARTSPQACYISKFRVIPTMLWKFQGLHCEWRLRSGHSQRTMAHSPWL